MKKITETGHYKKKQLCLFTVLLFIAMIIAVTSFAERNSILDVTGTSYLDHVNTQENNVSSRRTVKNDNVVETSSFSVKTVYESLGASASPLSGGKRYKDPLSGVSFMLPRGMEEKYSITEEYKSGAVFSTSSDSSTLAFICIDKWSSKDYYKDRTNREEIDNSYFLGGLTIALNGYNIFDVKKEIIAGQVYYIFPEKIKPVQGVPFQDFIKKYHAVCMKNGYYLEYILLQWTTDQKEANDSLRDILKTASYPMGASANGGSIHNIVKCFPDLSTIFRGLIFLLLIIITARMEKQMGKGKGKKPEKENWATKSIVFQKLGPVLSKYSLLNLYSGPLFTSIILVLVFFAFVTTFKYRNREWLVYKFYLGVILGEILFANLSGFLREREKEAHEQDRKSGKEQIF